MRQITRLLTVLAIVITTLALTAPDVHAQIRVTMHNRSVSNGDGNLLPTGNQATAVVTVQCTSCSGGTQINFEATNDGSNYTAILGTLAGTTTTGTTTTSSTTQVWIFSVPSFLNMKARVSAYSAGTITIIGTVTPQGGGGGGGGGGGSVTITDGVDTAAVTAGGDLQVSCSNCTGTGASKADDAAFGIATDSVAPVGFLFDDVATDTVNEGDVGLARMSANRVAYNILRDGAGNERAANVTAAGELNVLVGNTSVVVSQTTASSLATLATLNTSSAQIGHLEANQSVNVAQINGVTTLMGNGASGTGAQRVTIANDSTGVLAAVTNVATIGTSIVPGTSATHLGKAVDAVAGVSDTGVAILGIRDDALTTLTPVDGDYVNARFNSVGAMWVQSSIIDAAEDAAVATNPVPMGGVYRTASVTLDNGDVGYPRIDVDAFLQLNGSVAHDGADAGAPVKIGYKATTSISALTMVATADRTDAFAGIDGIQIVRLYSNLEDRVSATPVAVTDGSSTSLVAAQGSGIRFCATDITISNSSATNVTVDIRDGTAGAVLWTFPAAANMGGATHHFGQPLCTTANTAMATDPSASATTITTSVLGFKTKL